MSRPKADAESIFLAALERPDRAGRSAFVAAACGRDVALRQRVEALLHAHDVAGNFLGGQPAGADLRAFDLTDAVDAPPAGTDILTILSLAHGAMPRVLLRDPLDGPETPVPSLPAADEPGPRPPSGRYHFFGEIARGGMGAILKGHDTELNRDLAIKVLLDRHRDNAELVRRFVEEAQIGGQLQHPGIVPIYELGVLPDRRPFFAMKLVKGLTLSELLGGRPDPADDRPRLLSIFEAVCQTVAYAHARGVIHRDLKPSNVMVGSFGEVQVMDWGLAKVLPRGGVADDGHEPTREPNDPVSVIHTARSGWGADGSQAGSVLGTPGYMAPEQARGELDQVDERADVFGLGAILCEVLTGEPAFVGRTLAETLRNAGRGEMAEAFARLDGRGADSELIALAKDCLAPEPEGRPRDARAVSTRMKTHLVGVQDRLHASQRERAVAEARAVEERRKRRWQLSLAASVAASLLIGGVGLAAFTAALSRQKGELALANAALDRQRLRAEDREQQAIDAVKRFRDAVAGNPELKDNPGLGSLRKALLKEPLAFFRSLRDRLQGDGDTRPESLARLADASYELGVLTAEVGDEQDALAAHREALAIRRRLVEAYPDVELYRRDLARSHLHLGVLLQDTGQTAAARAELEAAVAIWRKLADDHPDVTDYRHDLALSHNALGVLLAKVGHFDDARAELEAALAIRRKLADDHPDVDLYQRQLAQSHGILGALLSQVGHLAEARPAFEAALAIQRKLADDHPDVDLHRRELAVNQDNFGLLLRHTGHPAEARAAHEATVAIRRKLVDDHPDVAQYRHDLANSHNHLGTVLALSGHPADARAALEAAVATWRKLADDHPDVTEYRRALAVGEGNFGNLLRQTGHPAEAQVEYEAALAIRRRLVDSHPEVAQYRYDLADSHNNFGILLQDTGHPDEARSAFEAAVTNARKLADDHPDADLYWNKLAESHNNLGILCFKIGHPAEARAAFEAALAIQRRLADAHPADARYRRGLAEAHNNLGALLYQIGHPAEARAAFEAALAIWRKLAEADPESPDHASSLGNALNNLGEVDLQADDFAAALGRLREAIAHHRKALAANPRNPIYRHGLRSSLRNLLVAAGKLDDADLAAEARRGLAELDAADPRLAALDARLAAVLKGEAPRGTAERLALAGRAYDTGRFAVAARLFAEALESDPALAADPAAGHRYNGACAAALAGCGRGGDDPTPDDAARAALRREALAWLRAELVARAKQLNEGPDAARQGARRALDHWKSDPDLAGIRNEAAVKSLPDDEQRACRALWAEVDRILGANRPR